MHRVGTGPQAGANDECRDVIEKKQVFGSAQHQLWLRQIDPWRIRVEQTQRHPPCPQFERGPASQ